MVHQLIYLSKTKEPLRSNDVKEINNISERENKKIDVTGCLIYYQKRFLQILEGEKTNVESLYRKIKADERHSEVTTLGRFETDSRIFPHWSMAFLKEKEVAKLSSTENILQQNLQNFSYIKEDENPASLLFWIKARGIVENQTHK
ncbi:MAG: BLUF domain-containing protein [Vicingaceae bacterium]